MKLNLFTPRFVEDECDRVYQFDMGLKIEVKKQVMSYELIIYANIVNKILIIKRKVNKEYAEREKN